MNFNDLDNEIALERQIRLILSSLGSNNVIVGHDFYNFRCPVCGDSKKSKSKKRGYILKKRKPWIFFCHNCYYKKPVTIWMKDYFPIHFKDYYREIVRVKENSKVKPLPKIINPKVRKNASEKQQTKYFVKIKDGVTPVFAKAIRTCIDRRIPEEVWSNWYISIGGMYNNRMIIPFFDDKGKIYYYQGRSLYDYMEPKYLSRKGDHNSIYNYYLVNKSKPVVVLEGPIDSIFVENSIAITGVKLEDERLKDFPYKRFLIDMDNVTTETKEKTLELLSKGEYVFCWKKFMKAYDLPMKDKWDVNEAIIYLQKDFFTFKELEPFFTNSIFDKVFFI